MNTDRASDHRSMNQSTLGRFSGSASQASTDGHECDACGRAFVSADNLVVHQDACGNDKKKTYECAECDDAFNDYISRRETRGRENFFCSRSCKDEFDTTGEMRSCAYCGSDVWVPVSHQESVDGYSIDNHFCDVDCESAHRKENRIGEDNPRWQGGNVELECEYCGDIFDVEPSVVDVRECCSQNCANNLVSYKHALALGLMERWSFEKDLLVLSCHWCGDAIERKPHGIKGDRWFCDMDCWSQAISRDHEGEGNPAYKGGEVGPYGHSWNRERRKRLNHDDFECVFCGISVEEYELLQGKGLDVHHVIPVRAFDDPDDAHYHENLATLCHWCHLSLWEGIRYHPTDTRPALPAPS